ncbi:hypothetical protein HMPREF9628_00344 [Peptoanaerobacter stomatis]|uniref:Uncharacterized protein n=1 Tax=Peptoanaerobacter stomatis TaxID=796937 RepID=G9XDA5_9FIRM|nr:hypothetical protein HMPREF9628_00344 [Peptoanaerobacter stomatis]
MDNTLKFIKKLVVMCKVSYNIKRKLMKNLILKLRELLYNVKKLLNYFIIHKIYNFINYKMFAVIDDD